MYIMPCVRYLSPIHVLFIISSHHAGGRDGRLSRLFKRTDGEGQGSPKVRANGDRCHVCLPDLGVCTGIRPFIMELFDGDADMEVRSILANPTRRLQLLKASWHYLLQGHTRVEWLPMFWTAHVRRHEGNHLEIAEPGGGSSLTRTAFFSLVSLSLIFHQRSWHAGWEYLNLDDNQWYPSALKAWICFGSCMLLQQKLVGLLCSCLCAGHHGGREEQKARGMQWWLSDVDCLMFKAQVICIIFPRQDSTGTGIKPKKRPKTEAHLKSAWHCCGTVTWMIMLGEGIWIWWRKAQGPRAIAPTQAQGRMWYHVMNLSTLCLLGLMLE